MDFNPKSYAKQRFRSSNKRGGRGGRAGHHAGHAPGPAASAPSHSALLDSNEHRFESSSEDDEQRADGTVAARSQGADFEELLQEADRVFAQASYRHRELRCDLEQEQPTLAAQDPQQELALDLIALDASLAPLPLHELLDMDPDLFRGVDSAASAGTSGQAPPAPDQLSQQAAHATVLNNDMVGSGPLRSPSSAEAYRPMHAGPPAALAAQGPASQAPGQTAAAPPAPVPASVYVAGQMHSSQAAASGETCAPCAGAERAAASDDLLLDELLANLTGTSTGQPVPPPQAPLSQEPPELKVAPALGSAMQHPAAVPPPPLMARIHQAATSGGVAPSSGTPLAGLKQPAVLAMLPTVRPASAAPPPPPATPGSSSARETDDAELHALLGLATGNRAPAAATLLAGNAVQGSAQVLGRSLPAAGLCGTPAPAPPASNPAQSLDDFLASL